MVTVADLKGQVERTYARLDLPTWPDPHPDREARPEEYSHITDPGRYRIVHARARAWTEALLSLPGVDVDVLEPAVLSGEGIMSHPGRFDRGVRITPDRPGTLALHLRETDVPQAGHDAPQAVLTISIARPDVALDMQPDCGCDACDSGSADLLHAVDQTIEEVVGGPYAALLGAGWHAHWRPDGGGSGSRGPRRHDHRALRDMCRRLAAGERVELPEDAEAFVGRAWI
jgi:hypothetical protein